MKNHLRNTFLTGIFAAIPLAVTIFVIVYVERFTREPVRQLIGWNAPFIGILLALAAIYLLGLAVGSLIGRFVLARLDRLLLRVPVLKEIYQAWKHISLTPGGKEGMYAKVVLIPGENEHTQMLGFTSGDGIPNDPDTWCVFVPGVPNPVAGRLYFVPRDKCRVLPIAAEEAFKYLLSSGNYIPPEVGLACGTAAPAVSEALQSQPGAAVPQIQVTASQT
jgi:uncharacterized membrane protein